MEKYTVGFSKKDLIFYRVLVLITMLVLTCFIILISDKTDVFLIVCLSVMFAAAAAGIIWSFADDGVLLIVDGEKIIAGKKEHTFSEITNVSEYRINTRFAHEFTVSFADGDFYLVSSDLNNSEKLFRHLADLGFLSLNEKGFYETK